MKIETIHIFSFFDNCKKCFDDNKKIKDINSLVNPVYFNRVNDFIIKKCSTILCYLKNNHFTYKDYKLYVLYCFMMNEKMYWKDIQVKEIKKVKKLFSNEQYNSDKKLLEKSSELSGFGNMHSLYAVNSNGSNVLFDLILQGKISPAYYIINYNKGKIYFENPKYVMSDKLKKINTVTEKINSILRR